VTCRFPAGRASALLYAFALAGLAAAETPPSPGFAWTKPSGEPAWRLSLEPVAATAEPIALEARAALALIPSFDLALLDGSRLESGKVRGKVVILEFWATWCGPCLKSLPKMQELWTAESPNGLVSIAMNSDEPEPTVRDFAKRLGLRLPIAMYDDAFSQALRVKTLPTVILVDKAGRIRGRWDGYSAGIELTIGDRVRALLAEPADAVPPGRRLADVLEGAGRFDVAWASDLPPSFRVSGLTVLGSGRGSRVVTTAGDMLAVLGADGAIGTRIQVPSSGWRLAAPLPAMKSDVDLVAWRPGSPDLLAIDLDGQRLRPWAAPSPVIDVEMAGGRATFATLGGIAFADLATGTFERRGDALPLRSVAAYGPGGNSLAVLDDGEKLQWFDAEGKTRRPASSTPLFSWSLACAAPDGAVGVVPSTVVATACGSFEPGTKGRQAAIALRTGDLLVVDLAEGRVRFRAAWPGIGDLAAGDLDGDGTDELIVGAGRTVAALKSTVPAK
jgi:thiol-disulfide isomerase/thioredoxin